MKNLTEIFKRIHNDPRWFYLTPGSAEQLLTVEERINKKIPQPVRDLYAHLSGGEWAGEHLVQFFDMGAMSDVNLELDKWLQGTFAFASDGGSLWYIVDVDDVLGKGKNTVWSLPAGAPFKSEVRYVADSTSDFIDWMVSS